MQFLLSNVNQLSFALVIFGYAMVSPFVSDANASRLVTVPYRAVALLFVISTILANLPNDSQVKKDTMAKYSQAPLDRFGLKITYLFILIYSLRLFTELPFNQNLVHPAAEYAFTWLGFCLLPAISFNFIEWDKVKMYFSISWIFSSIAIIEIFIYSFGSNVLTQSRLGGTALNPVSLGFCASLSIYMNLYILFGKTRNIVDFNRKLIRRCCIVILPISIYLLFMAGSRSPFLATLICFPLFLISIGVRGIKSSRLFYMIALLIFLVIALSIVSESNGSGYVERLISTADGSEFNNTSSHYFTRPELYAMANELIMNNLIIGAGVEVPGVGYPHNLTIEAFLTTGFFGGVLFTLINVCAIIKCWKIITCADNSWDWLVILFVQYLVLSTTSGSLYASSSFWCLLVAVFNCKESSPQTVKSSFADIRN